MESNTQSTQPSGLFIDLKSTCELPDGKRWVEITNNNIALLAAQLSGTDIDKLFSDEQDETSRWFFLMEETTECFGTTGAPINGKNIISPVCISVYPDSDQLKTSQISDENCHVIGFQNNNPLPEYGDDIGFLADNINLPIRLNYLGQSKTFKM